MTHVFNFELSGTDGNRAAWTVTGQISRNHSGDFAGLIDTATRRAFLQLTQGEVAYGKLGLYRPGPFTITKMLIEEVK